MSIKLSICIPTYNRADFIVEAIESIISQASNDIEIIISDNASTDNTEKIVRDYQIKFSHITYFRWTKNMGADRNFLKVIELAQGEYCWFMGSDDRVESGGIQHVLSQINSNQVLTGATVNQAIYSSDFKYEIKGVPVFGSYLGSDYLFIDAENCFSTLGLYFGYISGQIINRNLWFEVVSYSNLETYCNSFVHVYVIGRMLQRRPKWLYIHKRCVGYRSGNDSFLKEHGIYKRQVIAHASIEEIVRGLFGKKSKVYHTVLNTNLRNFLSRDIVSIKINGAPISLEKKLFLLYTKLYWRYVIYWIKIFPIYLIPCKVLMVMRIIYKHFLKVRKGNIIE